MKILALDYGTKRVGAAVNYLSLAEPLEIIPNDEHLLERIKDLMTQHRAKMLVVGISENEMAAKTQEFVHQLKAEINLPIELMDETLTSHQVHEWLRTAPEKKRRGPIDHLAAAVILQRYLDSTAT